MAEPPVPPYSTRKDQAEPTMFRKRLKRFARRSRIVIATLGVFGRAYLVQQLGEIPRRVFLVGRGNE